jgi:phosphoribosylaminoimidazole-succinocarboxamide synthase
MTDYRIKSPLFDTKYEFGFDENGAIVLADEVHTPDSSRYWLLASYSARFAAGEPPDTLDKDFIRRWVAARCDPYKDQFPEIPPDVILEANRTCRFPASEGRDLSSRQTQ